MPRLTGDYISGKAIPAVDLFYGRGQYGSYHTAQSHSRSNSDPLGQRTFVHAVRELDHIYV